MRQKQKIAVLINAFWNSGAGISGGDQRVMQIFKRISRDFEVDVYTSAEGKKVVSKEVSGAKFIVSPEKYERGNLLLRYRRRANWLIKELAKNDYDIVYSSSDFFPDVLPAYHYKRKNSKTKWLACVFHIYPNWRKRPGNKIVNILGSKIQDFSLWRIRERANAVVNINYQVKDELEKNYRFDAKKIFINPCGIDLDYFRKIKARKINNQVCFLARLAPSKGVFDLAEIWSEVVKQIPEAKLKIIGGGSDEIKNKLSAQFEEKSLSHGVKLLGFLPNSQAYKIMKESEVFIIPSYEEGFGIVIAESLAAGTPVVAWNLPVYDEVFPKVVETAVLGDKKAFAQKVVSLLKNNKIRSRLVSEGQNVIEKYSWEGIAKNEVKVMK